jgi:hypothetical protein
MSDPISFPSCDGRGLYILEYRGEVVYVGISTCNVFARLGRHARRMRFDHVIWHPLEAECDLFAVEREMIRELRPVYNSTHK